MNSQHASVLIQDGSAGWLSFSDLDGFIVARDPTELSLLLEEVESRVASGCFAAGFFGYEAAFCMDEALVVHEQPDFPLAWFGFYRNVQRISELPVPDGEFSLGSLDSSVSRADYDSSVERIKAYILSGDTYQVNYTIRLNAIFQGDPYASFYSLCRSQQANNCAFIDMGDYAICSASPELFFQLDDDSILMKPMKGTVKRGLTLEDDNAQAKWLHDSEKNRAENVMIVDMIRNDLGKVAKPGSIRVADAFNVERFPTVFQMTSVVKAETSASFPEIMKALFPCASITGAPKVRTMEIIKEIETQPRGIYTGSIGYIGNAGALGCSAKKRVARFNVAIRTLLIDKKDGTAEYGVGGGIVWDSDISSEYDECLIKAAVLDADIPDFDLLETILWNSDDGYFLIDQHLRRLIASAEYFTYKISSSDILERLRKFSKERDGSSFVVRLLVNRKGGLKLEARSLPESVGKVFAIALAESPVDILNPFLYHKTTNRSIYEHARASYPNCDDVILYNERRELTECTIANIVLNLGGKLVTPPVRCGLLAGCYRDYLLETGEIEEKVLLAEDLALADEIFLVNSVRKWIPAELFGMPAL